MGTLEVLGDAKAMAEIRESERAAARGEVYDWMTSGRRSKLGVGCRGDLPASSSRQRLAGH